MVHCLIVSILITIPIPIGATPAELENPLVNREKDLNLKIATPPPDHLPVDDAPPSFVASASSDESPPSQKSNNGK